MLNQKPTKRCCYCAETILAAAIKCRYCGEMLNSLMVEAASTRSGNQPQQRSFLRQPSGRISFERVLLYSSWSFVGIFLLLVGFFGILENFTADLISREDSSAIWPTAISSLIMTLIGLVMFIVANKIVNLKRGTTIIAGITTMLSILVFVSPLINDFVDSRDRTYPTDVIGIYTVLYAVCLIYATRRLRTLAS